MANVPAPFLIAMGDELTDRLSGFGGVVTARAEYSTGCRQYLLQPCSDDPRKYAEPHWFDEDRLTAAAAEDSPADSVLGGPAIHEAPRR